MLMSLPSTQIQFSCRDYKGGIKHDEVSWDIPKNLPKTTQLMIDGKAVYIHRANFAIINTELFNN